MRCTYRSFPFVFVCAAAWAASATYAADQATPTAKAGTVAHAPAKASAAGTETGLAAVYSDRLNGRKTASGKRYHRNALTAAHKTLPFGTRVKVTNAKNGKSVELLINDRGPRQSGRVLDISPAAAKALGFSRHGMAEVSVEVIGAPPHA